MPSDYGPVLQGQVAVPLMVRYPQADAPDLQAIRDTPLRKSTGGYFPVGVAEFLEDRSPNIISRENAHRKITVTANAAGRDLGSVVDDVRSTVAESIDLPTGYRIGYGGSSRAASRRPRR
jgi:nickel/cobalt tolerance cation efflux system protein